MLGQIEIYIVEISGDVGQDNRSTVFHGTATDTLPKFLVVGLCHGSPTHIRQDHWPKYIAKVLRRRLRTLQMEPLSILPGSSWQKRYIESFNGKMLERFLNGKLF